jgi:hypothetical protein
MMNRVGLTESRRAAFLVGVLGAEGYFFKEGGRRAGGSGYGKQLGAYFRRDVEVRCAACDEGFNILPDEAG